MRTGCLVNDWGDGELSLARVFYRVSNTLTDRVVMLLIIIRLQKVLSVVHYLEYSIMRSEMEPLEIIFLSSAIALIFWYSAKAVLCDR